MAAVGSKVPPLWPLFVGLALPSTVEIVVIASDDLGFLIPMFAVTPVLAVALLISPRTFALGLGLMLGWFLAWVLLVLGSTVGW